MAKVNGWLILLGVVVVALLAFMAFGPEQTQIVVSDDPAAQAQACGIDTTLTVTTVNALAKGTAVSPTYTAKVNGGASQSFTSGTTKLAPTDVVTILANASNYIDVIATSKPMVCGAGNRLDIEMYATDDVAAIEIFNDDGNKVTDDIAGGATNQTALSAGESLTLEVKFKGTNEESTGDLIYIIETPANTAANVTSIDMSGDAVKLTAIPSVHTTQNAGSKVVAFKIPAIVGAVTKTYDLTITLGSGKTLSGGIYTDVYSEQAFEDDDGTFKVGIQDQSGDSKYEDTSDSDVYVNAA